MTRGKLVVPLIAGLGATVLALTAAPVASAAPAQPPGVVSSSHSSARYLASVNGYQRLVDSVVAQVTALDSAAQLVEIDGSAPSGPSFSVFDQTRWRFVFNAVRSSGDIRVYFATVTLPNTVASVVFVHDLYVGSDPLTKPVQMSPHKAAHLLWKAGYRQPFDLVTYRQPNAGGPTAHPLFIFSQPGGKYVGVDTVTGVVAPLA